MTIVQACKATVGEKIKDRMKTLGGAATALLNLTEIVWRLGRRRSRNSSVRIAADPGCPLL
jgi:hypothetical protein